MTGVEEVRTELREGVGLRKELGKRRRKKGKENLIGNCCSAYNEEPIKG